LEYGTGKIHPSNHLIFSYRLTDCALPLFDKRNLLGRQKIIQMKKTTSIAKYIQRNQMRRDVYWKFHGGKWFFNIAGIWLHEKSFDKFYPLYEYKRNPNDNPDKTHVN
jgi:hypothetical protein